MNDFEFIKKQLSNLQAGQTRLEKKFDGIDKHIGELLLHAIATNTNLINLAEAIEILNCKIKALKNKDFENFN